MSRRYPVRRLVHAGPGDVPREAEEAGAGRVGWRADLRVLLRADGEDRWDRRDRLDVVDQRRRCVDAGDRRERRFGARLAALALKRFEQRRLLAADVRARAPMDDDLDLAEDAGLVRLVDCALQRFVLGGVLAADIDVHVPRLDRVRRNQAALDEPVRNLQHDLAVLEGPRLGLVRVDGDVDRLRDLVGRRDEARLAPGREERAAAAAEIRRDQLLDDRLRILRARLLELRIAADRAICVEAAQRFALVAGEDECRSLGDLDPRLSHSAPPRGLRAHRPGRPTADSGGRRPRWSASSSRRGTRRRAA